jgi:hypothetical protein
VLHRWHDLHHSSTTPLRTSTILRQSAAACEQARACVVPVNDERTVATCSTSLSCLPARLPACPPLTHGDENEEDVVQEGQGQQDARDLCTGSVSDAAWL